MTQDSPISEDSPISVEKDETGDAEKTSVSSESSEEQEEEEQEEQEEEQEKEEEQEPSEHPSSCAPSPSEGPASPASPASPKVKTRSKGKSRRKSRSSSRRIRRSVSRSRSRRVKRSCSNRHMTVCWYGRSCNRAECWFRHPDGRLCDENPGRKTKGKGKSGGKGEPCNFRRGRNRSNRSSSRQRYQSPEKSIRRRQPSRSASTKPPRPRRQKERENKVKEDRGTEVKNRVKDSSKKMNFREFMMHHCDEGASPEDAVVAFKVYCEDFVKKDLEVLKNTGLFFDLYHPMAKLRLHDWQHQMAKIRSRSFLDDLNGNKYNGLSLRARRPTMSGGQTSAMSATCPVAGHLKAPEFAFDANVGALMISGLPVAVSTWDVVEALQDFEGFVTAAWSAPALEKELSRTFYASFSDAKAAHAALLGLSEHADLLSNQGLTTGAARVSLLEASVDLSALVLPPEMSSPERLKKDLDLSAKVIQKMDGLFGISSGLSDAVLSHQLDTESQLDLQILYLRRVHHFCFYAGKWCKDEWMLRESCGAGVLREAPSESLTTEGSGWAIAHEKRIHDFLEVAMDKDVVGRPVVLHHQEPKVLERFQTAANAKILKVHDQKFQCQICNKFFKGHEYVFKHLHRSHPNILDDAREELHQELARSLFLADPDHPSAQALHQQ